jgi:hypothetical protein
LSWALVLQLAALECLPRGVACGVMPAETVVQHRARVGGEAGQPAQAACSCLLHGSLDQLRRLWFPAPPGREHHLGIRHKRVPGCLGDQVIFFDHQRCRGQFAGQKVSSGQ